MSTPSLHAPHQPPPVFGADSPEPSATRLVKFHAPEIVFGLGSAGRGRVSRPPGWAPAARWSSPTPGCIEAGWVDELLGHLREAGLRPVVWIDVTPNPKDHEIRGGVRALPRERLRRR